MSSTIFFSVFSELYIFYLWTMTYLIILCVLIFFLAFEILNFVVMKGKIFKANNGGVVNKKLEPNVVCE